MLKIRAQKSGHVVVLYLRGQIVVGDTNNLRRTVADLSDASVLILDLARVSRIDAHGLGVLVDLRQQLDAKGIEFRLMNLTKLVRQMLQITKLDTIFEVTTGTETVVTKANDVNAKPASKREDSSEFDGKEKCDYQLSHSGTLSSEQRAGHELSDRIRTTDGMRSS